MNTHKQLAIGLAKISLALKHHAWKEAVGIGLNPSQGQILSLLCSHEKPLSLSEIAEQMAVTPASISDAIAALEAKGFVRKQRNTRDGRSKLIRLTSRGRKAGRLAAQWPDFLQSALETLDEHEAALFLRTILKLIRSLQVRGAIPVTRMCVTCVYFRPRVHGDANQPHHCTFVDAPLGDAELRIDCPEHEPAPLERSNFNWAVFNRP